MFLNGLELVELGLSMLGRWAPGQEGDIELGPLRSYCVVARKP